jgi:hypothetical protein
MAGGAEAVRAERRARAAAAGASPAPSDDIAQGAAIIRSAWIGTVLFVIATAVAAFVPTARIPAVVVDLALLLAGSVVYFWGWGIAAGRSRDDQITLWNLILLEDAAPRRVRGRLLGALAVQIVVAAATCWITAALAFGWLVPVWGLAHCELWGARYGAFQARDPAPAKEGMTRRDRR